MSAITVLLLKTPFPHIFPLFLQQKHDDRNADQQTTR